jgi:hypothetical protein
MNNGCQAYKNSLEINRCQMEQKYLPFMEQSIFSGQQNVTGLHQKEANGKHTWFSNVFGLYDIHVPSPPHTLFTLSSK